MFCVACMICAHGVAVKFALALLLIVKGKNMQESIRLFVLSMDCIRFCVACMIAAHGVAVKIAVALLLICQSKSMQESVRLFVC